MTRHLHDPALANTAVDRIAAGKRNKEDDRVAVEAPVAFVYNCASHAVMMATPCDLEDFAYGFSISEGIVGSADEITDVRVSLKGAGYSLGVDIPEARAAALAGRTRNLEGRTGCGLCGVTEIAQALRPLPVLSAAGRIGSEALVRALDALPGAQVLNRETGAVHAAAFAAREDGRILAVREDVGRHNALDKLIGAVARAGLDPASGFMVVTSRCSMEMVQKTVTAGCPVLVAISAPTSLAIDLAERSNLTVAAFARGARINLYAHPERIV